MKYSPRTAPGGVSVIIGLPSLSVTQPGNRFEPTRVASRTLLAATEQVATSNKTGGWVFVGAAMAIGLVPKRASAPKVGTTLGWVAVIHIPTISACAASMAW